MKLKSIIYFAGILIISGTSSAAEKKADNSAINDRDKYLHEYTAEQQGMNKEDTDMTRRIRREITSDKSLSTYAHNVKIITMNGQVTLKGPVRTAAEAKLIVSRAQKIAGVSSVLNQMDITVK